MLGKRLAVAFSAALLAASAVSADLVDTCSATKKADADFVFLFDTSGSMCKYITNMQTQFQSFINYIAQDGLTARFAIGDFGGHAVLHLPFTSDPTEAANAIGNLTCENSGGNNGGTTESSINIAKSGVRGQESSLEAIRRTLLNDLTPMYEGETLDFSDSASLNIFVVTDEDSDLPTDPRYFNKLQLDEIQTGLHLGEPGWNGTNVVTASISYTEAAQTTSYYSYSTTVVSGSTKVSTITVSTVLPQQSTMLVRTSAAIPTLMPGFQQEVNETAALILAKGANVNIIMMADGCNVQTNRYDGWSKASKATAYSTLCPSKSKRQANHHSGSSSSIYSSISSIPGDCTDYDSWNTWTGAWQFGSPYAASENSDLSNFNATTTLANLLAYDLGNSLQAQVLQQGGNLRVYDIAKFTATSNVVNIFSAAVELVNYCVIDSKVWLITETTTVTSTVVSTYTAVVGTTEVAINTITSTTTDIVPTTSTVTETLSLSTVVSDYATATAYVTEFFTNVDVVSTTEVDGLTFATIVATTTVHETTTLSTTTTFTVSATSVVTAVVTQTSVSTAAATYKTTDVVVQSSLVVTTAVSVTTTTATATHAVTSTIFTTTVAISSAAPVSSGVSSGTIAGVVVGGVAAIGAAAAAIAYFTSNNAIAPSVDNNFGGLDGGNTNPLYASTGANGAAEQVNPIYSVNPM